MPRSDDESGTSSGPEQDLAALGGVPPAAPAEDPAVSGARDLLAIAGAQTYVTGEPSFVRRLYSWAEALDKKFFILGWNADLDYDAYRMMLAEYLRLVYSVAALSPRPKALVLRELETLEEEVRGMGWGKQIRRLEFELVRWIAESRMGLPPTVDKTEFDLDVAKVFSDHYVRLMETFSEKKEVKKVQEVVKKVLKR